jgi:hypothetical protein
LKRTGQGDVQAARALAEEHLDTAEGRPEPAHPEVVAYSHWSGGALRKALEAIETWYAAEPNPLSGIDPLLEGRLGTILARRAGEGSGALPR